MWEGEGGRKASDSRFHYLVSSDAVLVRILQEFHPGRRVEGFQRTFVAASVNWIAVFVACTAAVGDGGEAESVAVGTCLYVGDIAAFEKCTRVVIDAAGCQRCISCQLLFDVFGYPTVMLTRLV